MAAVDQKQLSVSRAAKTGSPIQRGRPAESQEEPSERQDEVDALKDSESFLFSSNKRWVTMDAADMPPSTLEI